MLGELGMVVRFCVVSDLGSLQRLVVQFTVTKEVAVIEVALILWQTLLRLWGGEKGLSNIILALNLFIRKTCASQGEEAGCMNLLILLERSA